MHDEITSVESAAMNWLIQILSPDFDDWAGLESWLAQAPEHAACFNQLSAIDAELAAYMPREVRRVPVVKRYRFAFAAGAAAAAVLAGVMLAPASTMTISTRAGEQREIALDHGARLALNGATELRYHKDDPRTLELVSGEVRFDVTHGSGKPLTITMGSRVLRDLGTVFDVLHTDEVTQVEVAQGKVVLGEGQAAITVNQGQGARIERAEIVPYNYALPRDAVSGWRSGRMVYRNAAISQIAGDLSRTFGGDVRIKGNLANQRFTGSFQTTHDLSATLAAAAPLIGASVRHEKKAWVLQAATDPGG